MLGPGCRESLGYLNWLYNPLQGLDASGIYDLLSTRAATEHGLYLNLGYWREASKLDTASEALALLVAEAARIGPADTVLDCGFGFAEQDILWAQRFGPQRIVGLNITASQVSVARRRVAELGLDGRIDLRHASATEMPIATESVDKVTALECAFHFRTRESFFAEAWRVLRPGGRLVVADIIPMPAASSLRARLNQRLSWGLVAHKFAIPAENAYTRPIYHAKLAVKGFEQIRVLSIREQVYGPLHAYLLEHQEPVKRLHPLARPLVQMALRVDAMRVYRGLDYVLATAVKPQRLPTACNLNRRAAAAGRVTPCSLRPLAGKPCETRDESEPLAAASSEQQGSRKARQDAPDHH